MVRSLLAALPANIHEVIGYSLGGRIALGLLDAAPKRFRCATIISAHPGLTDPRQRAERREMDQQWIRLLRTRGIPAFVSAWERQPLFQSQTRLPAEILQQQRQRRLLQRAEGLASALESLGLGCMPSVWDSIPRFPGHLRWIVGAEDSRFLDLAQRVKSLRPDTELHVLDDVGHNPLLESPRRLTRLLSR